MAASRCSSFAIAVSWIRVLLGYVWWFRLWRRACTSFISFRNPDTFRLNCFTSTRCCSRYLLVGLFCVSRSLLCQQVSFVLVGLFLLQVNRSMKSSAGKKKGKLTYKQVQKKIYRSMKSSAGKEKGECTFTAVCRVVSQLTRLSWKVKMGGSCCIQTHLQNDMSPGP